MKSLVIPLLLILLLPLFAIPSPVSGASSVPGSWTQTSRADFESGTLNNLDTWSSPGNVMLASGGTTQLMGSPAVNTTWILGSGTLTVFELSPGTAAPVSGVVVRCRFFEYAGGGGQFKLKIFRDNGSNYIFIGESQTVTSYTGFNSFDLTTPIPVRRGDILAYYQSGGGDLRVQYGGISYWYYADVTSNISKSAPGWNSNTFFSSVEADILPTVTGSLVSSVKDTGGSSTWGTISWNANTTTGSSISFSTRTSNDFTNWSPWSANYTSSGSAITSPSGRFIQYRAVLAANGTSTPVLHDITITYSTTPITNVLLSLSTQSVTPGSNITVSGMLSPNVITTVTLTYVKPDGTVVNRTTSSNAQGFFSDSYAPDTSGTWKVRASSAAVSTIGGATSAYSTFEVQAGSSFLGTFLPWLILIVVVVGFGVAVLLTKPKTPKMG